MQHITVDDFKTKVEEATKPVLVDFSAEWCPPCKMLAPVVERIALEYQDKLEVFGVDTDHSPELSQRFNISGVPTLIFFHNGQEIRKLVGFRDYDALKGEIETIV